MTSPVFDLNRRSQATHEMPRFASRGARPPVGQQDLMNIFMPSAQAADTLRNDEQRHHVVSVNQTHLPAHQQPAR